MNPQGTYMSESQWSFVSSWLSNQSTPLTLISLLFLIHSMHIPTLFLYTDSAFSLQCPLPKYPHGKQPHPLHVSVHEQFIFMIPVLAPYLKFKPSLCFPDQHYWFSSPSCTFLLFHGIYHLLLLYYKVTYNLFYFFLSFLLFFSLDCWNVGTDHFLIGSLMSHKCPKQFLSLKRHPVNICWINCILYFVKMLLSLGLNSFSTMF